MSSSYGYVPLAQAGQLQRAYDIASPATWTFTRQMSASALDLADFGGVEVSGPFSPEQITELTALGGGHFPSAEAFYLWLHQYD